MSTSLAVPAEPFSGFDRHSWSGVFEDRRASLASDPRRESMPLTSRGSTGRHWKPSGRTESKMTRPERTMMILAAVVSWACTDDVSKTDEVGDTGSETDTRDGKGNTSDDGDGNTNDGDTNDGDTNPNDGDTNDGDTGDGDGDTEDGDTSDGDGSTGDEGDTGDGDSDTGDEGDTSDGDTGDESDTDGDTGDGDADCGDGMQQPSEACDDGNGIAGDGCESDCTLTASIDWVVVRDPVDQPECSSIHRMEWRPDGSIATAGTALLADSMDWASTRLFVATWTTEGEIQAEFFDGGYISEVLNPPNLDSLPDGGLYVVRATDGELGSKIGAVWRLGPDLKLEWMKTADVISPWSPSLLPPSKYVAVQALPNGGALLMGHFDARLQKIDAQGQFVDERLLSPVYQSADMAKVGAQTWTLRSRHQFQLWGRLKRFDQNLDEIGSETEWALGDLDRELIEIEHHAGHTVVLGWTLAANDPDSDDDYPGLWRFDEEGTLTNSTVVKQLGMTPVAGMSITDDGTVVIAGAFDTFAIDPQGALLWHLPASDFGFGVHLFDTLVDEQGDVYFGGGTSVSLDFDCSEAVLAKVSWPDPP
ncbi:hypothetical protein ACNOYE_21900 [Nannocystaceae bacterium ST9]